MSARKNKTSATRNKREAAAIGAFPRTAVEKPYKQPSQERLRDDTQNSTSYAKSLVAARACPDIIKTPGPNTILKSLVP